MLLFFAVLREYTIGKRLVEGYLSQPYVWFLDKNSSDIGKNILSEVQQATYSGLIPLLNLFTQSVVALAILTLMFLVDAKIAIIMMAALGGSYICIFCFSRGYLKRIGQERLEFNAKRYRYISEGFGAIRELKLGNLEKFYVSQFSDGAKQYAEHHASVEIISQLPRFGLEAVAFGGMILLSLFIIGDGGTITQSLHIIALYAFAGYRLMPALQQIYASYSKLKFSLPTVSTLLKDLSEIETEHLKFDQ